MNAEFQKIINQMEPLLRKLRCSDPRTVENLKGVPQRGVYVFYEGDKPFYTGRSRRIRQRIYEHGGTSSRHESATFAFKLFREAIGEPEGHSSKYSGVGVSLGTLSFGSFESFDADQATLHGQTAKKTSNHGPTWGAD